MGRVAGDSIHAGGERLIDAPLGCPLKVVSPARCTVVVSNVTDCGRLRVLKGHPARLYSE